MCVNSRKEIVMWKNKAKKCVQTLLLINSSSLGSPPTTTCNTKTHEHIVNVSISFIAFKIITVNY